MNIAVGALIVLNLFERLTYSIIEYDSRGPLNRLNRFTGEPQHRVGFTDAEEDTPIWGRNSPQILSDRVMRVAVSFIAVVIGVGVLLCYYILITNKVVWA